MERCFRNISAHTVYHSQTQRIFFGKIGSDHTESQRVGVLITLKVNRILHPSHINSIPQLILHAPLPLFLFYFILFGKCEVYNNKTQLWHAKCFKKVHINISALHKSTSDWYMESSARESKCAWKASCPSSNGSMPHFRNV